MIVNPSYYRHQAKMTLHGNWQTALLVTFFSGSMVTALSLLINVISSKLSNGLYDKLLSFATAINGNSLQEAERFGISLLAQYRQNLQAIPNALWIGLLVSFAGLIFLTPALKTSEANYYLNRLKKVEIGVWKGLFGRFSVFFKCLGVYLLMALRILLWALLIVPGAIASYFLISFTGLTLLGSVAVIASCIPALLCVMRYCFSPLFLAEDPMRSPAECLRLSKQATYKRLTAVFGVMVIFVLYELMAELALDLLSSIGIPETVIIVISLAVTLFIDTYSMTTFSCLFDVMAHPEAEAIMHGILKKAMKAAGFDDETIERMIKGKRGAGAEPTDDEKSAQESADDQDSDEDQILN